MTAATASGGGSAADVGSEEYSGEENEKTECYGDCVTEADGTEVLRKGVVGDRWGVGYRWWWLAAEEGGGSGGH